MSDLGGVLRLSVMDARRGATKMGVPGISLRHLHLTLTSSASRGLAPLLKPTKPVEVIDVHTQIYFTILSELHKATAGILAACFEGLEF